LKNISHSERASQKLKKVIVFTPLAKKEIKSRKYQFSDQNYHAFSHYEALPILQREKVYTPRE
jgi:hypothetical protein